MSRKGITEKQYDAVKRASAEGQFDSEIAAKAGIKESTVKAIRRSKTYTAFDERRKAKAQKASANRALNPAPLPESTFKPPKLGVKASPSKGLRSVAEKQAKTAVTEEPVSPYLLNEAYKEFIALKTELLGRVESAEDLAEEAKLDARKAVKAVAEIQREDVRQEMRKRRSFLPWRRS